MLKATQWIQRVVSLLLGVLLVIFCLYMLQGYHENYEQPPFAAGKVILFAVLFSAAALLLVFSAKPSGHTHLFSALRIGLMGVLGAAVFCAQLLFAAVATTEIGWDTWSVYAIATSPDMSGAIMNYLVDCPNNFMLALTMRFALLAADFFQISDLWVLLNLCNVIALDIALLTAAFLCRRLFSPDAFYPFLLLGILLLGCSPWILVPYTDVIAVLLCVVLLCCCLCWWRAKTLGSQLLWSLILGLVCWVSYNFKASLLILFIAGVCTLLLQKLRGTAQLHFWKRVLAGAACCFTLFFCLQGGWNLYFKSKLLPEQKEALPKTTMDYYFLTGLTRNGPRYGGYYHEITEFVKSFKTKEERRAGTRQRAEEMLSELGAVGLAQQFWNKIVWSSIDGTFFYGGEGEFHHNQPQTTFGLRGKLQNFTYTDTSQYKNWVCNFLQGAWLATCFFAACGCFLRRIGDKPADWVRFLLRLSILGVLCYVMIFEARSRYLIFATPLYLMLAADGAALFFTSVQQLCTQYQPLKFWRKKQ